MDKIFINLFSSLNENNIGGFLILFLCLLVILSAYWYAKQVDKMSKYNDKREERSNDREDKLMNFINDFSGKMNLLKTECNTAHKAQYAEHIKMEQDINIIKDKVLILSSKV